MVTKDNYTEENSKAVDSWVKTGWIWSRPITHGEYLNAKLGKYRILLTPTIPVPEEWIGPVKGKKVLALASGGGQQGPVFQALGADVTILDYSEAQLGKEKEVALREGYEINLIRADMTRPLPFDDSEFDMVFNPVSTIFIEDVAPLWKECARIVKKGGVLMTGIDNGINYIVEGEGETRITHSLPYNPLKDPALMQELKEVDAGIQFSHSLSDNLQPLLKNGFMLTDIYEDTNGEGRLHEMNIPTFVAMRLVRV